MIKECALHQGDCHIMMDCVKDSSVNMILLDPPYESTPYEWDKALNFDVMWNHFERVLVKNGCVLIFGQEPFSSFVRLSKLNWYKYDWYWQKERLTNVFQVKRRPGKVIETISVFYKKQCTYNPQKSEHQGKPVSNKIGENARWSVSMAGHNAKSKPKEYIDDMTRHPLQIIKFQRDNSRTLLHPTQKPLALIEFLIKTYTNPGDVVLDCCLGSGTTGVGTLKLNREFIGIEKDLVMFNIANERICNADY